MTTACAPLARTDARPVVDDACCRADALLDARIADLWSAKSDPEATRLLLEHARMEVAAARTLLAEAGSGEWWSDLTAARLADACIVARLWTGDPACADLERVFASRLRTELGIDLASIPRRSAPPA